MGIDLLIFDLDGTVYRGTEPTPHAAETLARLRRSGRRVRFATNNSAILAEKVVERLRGLGIEAEEAEVLTSAQVAAEYALTEGLRSAFVVGDPGLCHTLRRVRIDVVNASESGDVSNLSDGTADCVIVGICRTFSCELLDGAMQWIRSGARFLATNRDATYPLEQGRLQPGAGPIVAAIETASQTSPMTMGKPEPRMVKRFLRETGIPAERTLVIGDRTDTDIESGLRAGCQVHLVLCGVTSSAPEGVPASPDLRGILARCSL
ncbi:MAG: HAD-IIA family hydrolase [Fimbriimonadaceae bacterium]|nr:HAD-IIA family hydrolase [Fimbriimonadaceae bacterium]NUM39888.1 HAD-IIA family hydrolase [Armatimonadota bacterium]